MLEGFSTEMQEEWDRYMNREFPNDLFISLPVRVPNRSTPVAVLNVNVNVEKEASRQWYRAYGKQWTAQAEEFSTEFTELALRALALSHQIELRCPALDLGVPVTTPAMLPAPASEGEEQ